MTILFIHIPKTGGTSIRTWFDENVNIERPNSIISFDHTPYYDVVKNYGNFDWSFTVVRNTYERLVSLYLYSWNKSKRRMEKGIKNNTIDEDNTFITKIAEEGIIKFLNTFIDEKRNELAGRVLPRLISQLEYSNGVDYILRHDNLINDFKIVQEKLNCFIPLTQKRNYMGTEELKLKYYTPEFFKIIEKYYGEEIEYFKFSRPAQFN